MIMKHNVYSLIHKIKNVPIYDIYGDSMYCPYINEWELYRPILLNNDKFATMLDRDGCDENGRLMILPYYNVDWKFFQTNYYIVKENDNIDEIRKYINKKHDYIHENDVIYWNRLNDKCEVLKYSSDKYCDVFNYLHNFGHYIDISNTKFHKNDIVKILVKDRRNIGKITGIKYKYDLTIEYIVQSARPINHWEDEKRIYNENNIELLDIYSLKYLSIYRNNQYYGYPRWEDLRNPLKAIWEVVDIEEDEKVRLRQHNGHWISECVKPIYECCLLDEKYIKRLK